MNLSRPLPVHVSKQHVRYTFDGSQCVENFGQFFNANLLSAVEEAIIRVGWRSSLAELADACCQVEGERYIADLKQAVRIAEQDRNVTEVSYFKGEIVWVTSVIKAKRYPHPNYAAISTLRQRLGSPYDCRTHRDVPARNMIEPQRRVARLAA